MLVWAVVLAAALSPANPDEVARALRPDGRPRLVHLWASWCEPCVAELRPVVAALRRAERRGIDTVLLSIDNADGQTAAERLLKQAGGAPGISLRADSPRAIAAVRGLDKEWDGSIPTTYLLRADGTLVLAQRGGTDLAQLASEVERLPRSPRRRH